MVTEYINRGSLFDVIRKFRKLKRRLPFKSAIRILIGVARGMAYLHGKGVIHRDLKSGNILLDKNWNAKIADFGISKLEEEMEIEGGGNNEAVAARDIMTQIGTPRWMAPEVIDREGRYTEKVDIYSFAMVMYEMITGRVPFESERYDYILHGEIASGRRPVVNWDKGLILIDLDDKGADKESFRELTEASSKDLSNLSLDGSLGSEGSGKSLGSSGSGGGNGGGNGEQEMKEVVQSGSETAEQVRRLEELMKRSWNANPDERGDFLEIVERLVGIEAEYKKITKKEKSEKKV
eukprot:TRINITY_DN100_c1_g1_i2.p1 TRINITY_DN100_c1_g1~~TRINITY_DN100_c1_g1_i2.p1  ORF type:complete len:293 (-),score=98.15 TRINITY_DN100_c1_g1_i2:36-914(-)